MKENESRCVVCDTKINDITQTKWNSDGEPTCKKCTKVESIKMIKEVRQRIADQEFELDKIIGRILEGSIDDDHDLANELENISHELMSIKISLD